MDKERPLFFDSIESLPAGCQHLDIYAIAREELHRIRPDLNPESIWVYYPWSNIALCTLRGEEYFVLRTARNRNIITDEEQSVYRAGHVAIAGLSVGSAALESIVATGGPKHLRLADPDIIEISNLNRIRACLLDIGLNKTLVAARRVWEIDPFAEIDVFSDGVTAASMSDFLSGTDVAVDEMDTIPLKFALRNAAKERGIPVVMGTDNGDSAIIDVERFDLEPDRPIFHGRVDETVNISPSSRAEFSALAARIIDSSLFTRRQFDSVQLVGTTLPGVPQLATAAAIAGAGVAYAVRMIITKQDLPSGRYVLGCDASFAQPLS
jgi:molybdopterin/thiamine biosynthesis adenylyltransferase